jgi:hypothetical protein
MFAAPVTERNQLPSVGVLALKTEELKPIEAPQAVVAGAFAMFTEIVKVPEL